MYYISECRSTNGAFPQAAARAWQRLAAVVTTAYSGSWVPQAICVDEKAKVKLVKLLTSFVLALGLMVVSGCAESMVAQPSPTPRTPCPKLEDRLYRLAQAEDPAQFARQNGLDYVEGQVRVIVEMVEPEAAIPEKYASLIESRSDGLVQMLIPPKELCELSQEPEVKLVRVPLPSVPLGG